MRRLARLTLLAAVLALPVIAVGCADSTSPRPALDSGAHPGMTTQGTTPADSMCYSEGQGWTRCGK